MNKRLLVLIGIVVAAALTRLAPHPPNFTPIAAMALFGGACFASRKTAYLVPLAAMLLSDIVLGYLHYGWSLLDSQPVVYACLLAMVTIGRLLRHRRTALPVGAAALACSIMFYVVTNFAVWASGGLYPKTWAGLTTCYVAAIPFFGYTIAGDLVFSAVLFGGLAFVEHAAPALCEDHALAPS